MAKQIESRFKEKVLRDLKQVKCCWFFKSQEVSKRGIPDIIICKDGKFWALELKVDARTTDLQKYNLKKITEAGGTALIVTPDNWAEVLGEIDGAFKN